MQIDEHISFRGIVVFILIGLAFVAFGVMSKMERDQLNAEGQVTEGRITSSRVMEKKGRKMFEVQRIMPGIFFRSSPRAPAVAVDLRPRGHDFKAQPGCLCSSQLSLSARCSLTPFS